MPGRVSSRLPAPPSRSFRRRPCSMTWSAASMPPINALGHPDRHDVALRAWKVGASAGFAPSDRAGRRDLVLGVVDLAYVEAIPIAARRNVDCIADRSRPILQGERRAGRSRPFEDRPRVDHANLVSGHDIDVSVGSGCHEGPKDYGEATHNIHISDNRGL